VSAGDRVKVAALITEGANVNAKDNNGETPLHSTAHDGGSKEVAELLIAKGAHVNAKDNDGYTPLHTAANVNPKEVAEFLITKGAHANAKDNYGNTPMHFAAEIGSKEVFELLIYKGARANVKNNDGMTPLALAEKNKRDEIVAFFETELPKQNEMAVAAQLKAMLQKREGNQREAFNRAMAYYKGRPMSDDIRRPFITLAAKLKPAPTVPEQARKYLVRGNALMGDAKNPDEADAAIQEYQNALLAAPWWDDAYFNLSKAQELAGDLDGAVSSMQYYLLTEPQDKREAQDRLYAIEAKRDKAKGK